MTREFGGHDLSSNRPFGDQKQGGGTSTGQARSTEVDKAGHKFSVRAHSASGSSRGRRPARPTRPGALGTHVLPGRTRGRGGRVGLTGVRSGGLGRDHQATGRLAALMQSGQSPINTGPSPRPPGDRLPEKEPQALIPGPSTLGAQVPSESALHTLSPRAHTHTHTCPHTHIHTGPHTAHRSPHTYRYTHTHTGPHTHRHSCSHTHTQALTHIA